MAEYNINFSTNASQIAKELSKVQTELAKAVQMAKPSGLEIKLSLNTSQLEASINTTFRKLNKEIESNQRKLSRLQIGGGNFDLIAGRLGRAEGQKERGQLLAAPSRLRGQAEAFEFGSEIRSKKILESLRIQASQIAPNTVEWTTFQQLIGQVTLELKQADKAAESIQLTQQLGALAPGSLSRLDKQLTILKNRAREIAPNTIEWKKLNKEIQNVETSIAKVNKKPMTMGQRAGAAGGAFLYGGGLGGGTGSALGGIAGGLIGGVPGAFTGAAVGQAVDNLTTMTAAMTDQAAAISKLQMGLATASNDLTDFALATREVDNIATRLQLPLEEVYRKFTQLRSSTVALGIDTKTTGQIFEGTAAAVLKSGGSMDDVSGAMRAVVQVFSKGKLTAEELRGQLGERLPGAVVEFAKSSGRSVQELDAAFDAGGLTLDEFVTFLRGKAKDSGDFVDEMSERSEYAGARMAKAFEKMRLNIGTSLQPTGAAIQDFITRSINGFDLLIRKAIELKLMQPGADFYVGQALTGGNGGIAGLENQLLAAAEAAASARDLASRGGLGFLADLLPEVKATAKEAKILGEALTKIRNLEKLTKQRKVDAETQGKKDQAAEATLGAIEKREEAISGARQRREEELAGIRGNAIKEAEALERSYAEKRIEAERQLAKVRRDLIAAAQEESLIKREISSGLTKEDTGIIEAERAAQQIIKEYTEENIRAEQEAQDKQIAIARELEDFKQRTASAINEANRRYAKAIGDAQINYAKSVAKIIDEGMGKSAKRLVLAGQLAGLYTQRATLNQQVGGASGIVIPEPQGGKYNFPGQGTFGGEELLAADAFKDVQIPLRALLDADRQIKATMQSLSQGMQLSAAAPSAITVNTADIEAGLAQVQKEYTQLFQSVAKESTALNLQVNLRQKILELFRDQLKEGNNIVQNTDKEIQSNLELVDLMRSGVSPELAKQRQEGERIFDQARNKAVAAADAMIAGTKDKDIQSVIRALLVDQLKTVDALRGTYQQVNEELQQSLKLLEGQERINELQSEIKLLRIIGDDERRLAELREQYGTEQAAQQIFNLEEIKKNIEATRALIDDFVSSTTGDYKGFLKAVISGEDAADALKQFQEGLTDKVLTIFLDFAMAPIEKSLKEGLFSFFKPKVDPKLLEQQKSVTALADNTAATRANTNALKGLQGGAAGAAQAPPVIPFGESADAATQSMSTISEAFSSGLSTVNTSAQGWNQALNFGLPSVINTSAQQIGQQGGVLGNSLGSVTGVIGAAASSIMGIVAGVSQMGSGGTSGVLGGIGSIFMGLGGALGGIGGMFGGGLSSAFSGGASSAIGTGASGWSTAFATPLRFANGGMVTGPTLGLVGEGKYNEAIVPLPDGRSIPVQMKGASGGGLREAMSGNNGKASGSPILNMSFQSTNINGVEYVSRDQLEAAMATTRKQAAKDGANRGMSMTLDKLQQSPQTRNRLGMR
jgi:tape measure domain-containing protein